MIRTSQRRVRASGVFCDLAPLRGELVGLVGGPLGLEAEGRRPSDDGVLEGEPGIEGCPGEGCRSERGGVLGLPSTALGMPVEIRASGAALGFRRWSSDRSS